VFEAMDELQLESARSAWEQGGAPAVASYMTRLNRAFGSVHFLLNGDGIDVVSGEPRSALLPATPLAKSRGYVQGNFIVTHKSEDGHYWFVAVDPRPAGSWPFFPYYMLVIGVTGLLCWLAALGVISPIRKVTAVVQRFGRGDLTARLNSTRRDEIGGLARSFDEMAERMQTLLMSERQLLEDISHELRSPLTRLKLAVRLARTAPDHQVALDRVERDVNRITTLVSEIVEITRMEGDPQCREAERVNLAQVVAEIIDDCKVEAQLFRGTTIQVSGKVTCDVSGDPELLRRALENILRNAIRFSPERSQIDVTLAENTTGAVVSVRDYGPGVPEGYLTQIFEPFFRVDRSRDEQSGGVGLGLSIAKRAVRLHRGALHAANAYPGLRVEMHLPLPNLSDDGSSRNAC
jgi:signal transduction histidine kinase